MSRRLFALLALALAALACNWSDLVPPAAPVIEPSPLPTFAIPSLTPTPTETPLPTLTPTPDVPIAWPKSLGVNCRYGPGKEWETVSSLLPGTIAEIKGRTVDTAWWLIQDPLHAGDFCWVAYDVVDTAGNLNVVPLAEEPSASVTNVSVDALVAFTACGGSNAVTFKGTITANGPATVTYHWEVSGDKQMVMPEATIEFSEASTQKPTTDAFSADCGNYSVALRVTDPTEISAEKKFNIQAP
jgi:hypothetical protein